jgi:hypothetical protein
MINFMTKKPTFMPSDVHPFLASIFEGDVHAKRVASMADATLGILNSGALGIHKIGRGLAIARGIEDKSAIKQVDRLLGNHRFDVPSLFHQWVPFVIGQLEEIRLNMDWTEFDSDDHTQLVLSLQTHHGRSIPVIWKTHLKSELKNMMETYERALLLLLRSIIPENVHVTIVADRGFGKLWLLAFIKDELHFDYIIRTKANYVVVASNGERRKAGDWIGVHGKMRVLRGARLTGEEFPVATIVCLQDKGMKDPWCIVSSIEGILGRAVVAIYGKRFTIEEMFRDVKDLRFGMGMSWNAITKPDRRDRMLLLAAFAQALLTVLGQAGEDVGLDRTLKANTVKTRTLSLLRQGIMWFERIPMMPEEKLKKLMTRFTELMCLYEPYKSLFVME